jgi:hypothetical protein
MARERTEKDDAEILAVWNARPEGAHVQHVSRVTTWDRMTIMRVLRKHGIEPTLKGAGVSRGQPEAKTVTSGDSQTVEFYFASDKAIITEADAIAFAQIDLTRWYVDRMIVNDYVTPMKLKGGQDEQGRAKPDRPTKVHNHQVKLFLKRIQPKVYEDVDDLLIDRLAKHSPKYPAQTLPKLANPHLLVIGIFDAHFGKLCWSKETGQNYDLKIAERIYREAVEDILACSSGFPVDQILFPIGSDLLHVDGLCSTTTAGTFQDSDGRYPKIVETAEASVCLAIERAATIAPVVVQWVPGNHDTVSSYHLGRTVAAWFRFHPNVTVDISPTPRKYHRYGVNLIGTTHGDKEKRSELPIIMATERAEDWGVTTCREFLIGHTHASKVTHSTSVDSQVGVVVRTLRSIAAQDAWHASKGYLAQDRAAEAYLYSYESGYVANFIARPRIEAA